VSSISSENLIVDSPATLRSASSLTRSQMLACYSLAGHGDFLPRMTAPPSSSLSSSSSMGLGAEVSLQCFTLESGLSETLSEVVLRSVASSVSSVADNGNDHFLILFVVSEYRFESFGESEEFALSNGRSLEHLGFHLSQVEVAPINAVVSVPASIALEEPVVGLAHQSRSLLVANVVLVSCSSVASAEVMRLSHGLGEDALLGASLIFIHEFSEVRVITLRNHILLFD
jgi:hypothetical protein